MTCQDEAPLPTGNVTIGNGAGGPFPMSGKSESSLLLNDAAIQTAMFWVIQFSRFIPFSHAITLLSMVRSVADQCDSKLVQMHLTFATLIAVKAMMRHSWEQQGRLELSIILNAAFFVIAILFLFIFVIVSGNVSEATCTKELTFLSDYVIASLVTFLVFWLAITILGYVKDHDNINFTKLGENLRKPAFIASEIGLRGVLILVGLISFFVLHFATSDEIDRSLWISSCILTAMLIELSVSDTRYFSSQYNGLAEFVIGVLYVATFVGTALTSLFFVLRELDWLLPPTSFLKITVLATTTVGVAHIGLMIYYVAKQGATLNKMLQSGTRVLNATNQQKSGANALFQMDESALLLQSLSSDL